MLARRLLAVGVGLLVLILVVLGVKGCLDARKQRDLKDYASKVSQIVTETDQTSKRFFGRLNDPANGPTTVDFQAEIDSYRSAMDSYLARVDDLSAPGDMSHAQNALELVYELRASAMGNISAAMQDAFVAERAPAAVRAIARQMRVLLSSDVLYAEVVRPEINGVLAANGIEGSDLPVPVKGSPDQPGQFLENGLDWLDEAHVQSAISQVPGASSASAADSGTHGTGLVSVSVNGTTLSTTTPTTITGGGTPVVSVEVQEQGGSSESDITVSVAVNGGSALTGTIKSLGPGETQTATIPLTPAPTGSVTLDVNVDAVPGEQILTNNKATYSVVFG